MYFASLASMQVHPGAGTKEHRKLTLHECADMAMTMLDIRQGKIAGMKTTLNENGEPSCPGE
jgi:hypothetical protein